MTTSMRDALAFISEHAELFSAVVDKKTGTLDVAALETFAVRGDALRVIGRKTTFSAEVPEGEESSAQETFADMLFALAAEVAAGVNRSGTSGQRRITVTTPSGKLNVTLED